MNRRGFFGQVFGAGAAAVVPTLTSQPLSLAPTGWPTMDQPEIYKGYRIHWSGWKGSHDSMRRVGQWLAWHGDLYTGADPQQTPPYLYLNVPNFVGGPYSSGDVFYIADRQGRSVLPETTLVDAEHWIGEGRLYIRRLVDHYAETRAGDQVLNRLQVFPDGGVI